MSFFLPSLCLEGHGDTFPQYPSCPSLHIVNLLVRIVLGPLGRQVSTCGTRNGIEPLTLTALVLQRVLLNAFAEGGQGIV